VRVNPSLYAFNQFDDTARQYEHYKNKYHAKDNQMNMNQITGKNVAYQDEENRPQKGATHSANTSDKRH
jgi:hypothetical protein